MTMLPYSSHILSLFSLLLLPVLLVLNTGFTVPIPTEVKMLLVESCDQKNTNCQEYNFMSVIPFLTEDY